MAGKKSHRALEKEGLQRTDNNMTLTTIATISMINQKNYYTDFLKRDDQFLALRNQSDEARTRLTKAAVDKDRALAQTAQENGVKADPDVDMPDTVPAPPEEQSEDVDDPDAKIIVIHPGSQNLRLGLANDALPKTVPMVIARRSAKAEFEEHDQEPLPKRPRLADADDSRPDTWFGNEFANEYNTMAAEFKTHRRVNKRRVLPNSRDLVVKWNSQMPPDLISEHNDHMRIDWTEIDQQKPPEHITGKEALRIPDTSKPRYRLSWPWQNAWLNEGDYASKRLLLQDFFLIIEEAIINQLNVRRKKDLAQYSCVFVIPDLYEKVVVASILHELLCDLGFSRVAFIQESVAATFGAGYSTATVVDIGAQKTSICCVEDGLCLEDTRMNLKVGGEDVTQTFIKMMLHDSLNYSEINLKRRYDYLLAEELKQRFCTLSDDNISVQQNEFYVRAYGQDTRKYQFKVYDEGMLASMVFYRPKIQDHSSKLKGRRAFIDRSRDTYDGSANDPMTPTQLQAFEWANENVPSAVAAPAEPGLSTTSVQPPQRADGLAHLNHLVEDGDQSINGSPIPEATDTNGVVNNTEETNGTNGQQPAPNEDEPLVDPTLELQDRTVPLMPLDAAILASITEGSRGDERKMRDFLGGITVIGGGSKIFNFNAYLEQRLRNLRPDLAKEILVGPPPRELDPAVLVWKGASVFGKLEVTNECWVGGIEYDRLGARILNYKSMWAW